MHDNDYRTLGIAPGVGLLEVRRAYERMTALYAENSLATYSLLEPQEHAARVGEIEASYQRILRERTPPRVAVPAPSPQADADLPDPAASPGLYLRRARERAGLTLREIAERTKISPMKLDAIEQENWPRLPAPVYLRGFVFELARTLALPEPAQLARLFLSRSPLRENEG